MFFASYCILFFMPLNIFSENVLRVLIPLEARPEKVTIKSFLDPISNKPKGFYIDMIDELFKSMNMSYSLEFDAPKNYTSYAELSKCYH